MSANRLAEIERHLDAMRTAHDDVELLTEHDAAFHRAVTAATENQTLVALLEGISARTIRARIWRGLVEQNTADRTLAEHEAIHDALATGNAPLAHAAALMHVHTTERWFRQRLSETE